MNMTLQLFSWLATIGIIGIFVHAVRLWFVSLLRYRQPPPAPEPRTASSLPSWCPHSTKRG